LWEPVHEHRPTRYRKSEQRKCQYRGCLIEAVAIIMFYAEDDEVMRWIFDEIEKGGKNIEV
jgi:hypothetical protein